MFKLNQKGFAHIFIVLILVIGLVAGVYLVQKQTFFKPKAGNTGTRVEIIDKTTNQPFANGVAATRNVRLKLTYVAPTPTASPSPQVSASPSQTVGPKCQELFGKIERAFLTGCNNLTAPDGKAWDKAADLNQDGRVDNLDQTTFYKYQYNETFCDSALKTTYDKCAGAPTPTTPTPTPAETATPTPTPAAEPQIPDCPMGLNCAFGGSTASEAQCSDSSKPYKCLQRSSGMILCCNQPSVQGVSTAFAQTQQFPTHFRVSNDRNSLSAAQEFAMSGNPTEVDWELAAGDGQKTVFAQFKVNGSYDDQTILSDTITLQGAAASNVTPTPVNRLLNGNFESGLSPWWRWNPTAPASYDDIDTSVVRPGSTKSAKGLLGSQVACPTCGIVGCLNQSSDHNPTFGNTSLFVNKTVTYSVWYKTASGGLPSIKINIKRNNGWNSYWTPGVQNGSVTDNDWRQLQVSAVIPEAVDGGAVQGIGIDLCYSGSAGSTVWFDDAQVSFQEATSPTAQATPTPTPTPTTQQRFTFNFEDGWNAMGWPIRAEGRWNVTMFLNQTGNIRPGGTTENDRICTEIKKKDVTDPDTVRNTGITLRGDDALVPGKGYMVRCVGPARIPITGTPFTETESQLKARLGNGWQWISFAQGAAYTAESFLQMASVSRSCTEIDKWEGRWIPHLIDGAANNFQINDPTKGYNVKCVTGSGQAPSSPRAGAQATPTPAPFICTACAADINRDGAVTTLDFSLLQRCFNKSERQHQAEWTSNNCAAADINGDKVVSALDFSCLSAQFSKECPANRPRR